MIKPVHQSTRKLFALLFAYCSCSNRRLSRNTELPFLVAHLSLCTEDGSPLDGEDAPGAPPIPQRLLYGTLVSSAQVLRNLRGHVSPYFIFPDVSIRQRGRYRLKITLMRLPRFAVLSSRYTSIDIHLGLGRPAQAVLAIKEATSRLLGRMFLMLYLILITSLLVSLMTL